MTGVLTFDLRPRQDGGTEIVMTYVVSGYMRGGGERLAGPVDAVMAEQLTRLARYADRLGSALP